MWADIVKAGASILGLLRSGKADPMTEAKVLAYIRSCADYEQAFLAEYRWSWPRRDGTCFLPAPPSCPALPTLGSELRPVQATRRAIEAVRELWVANCRDNLNLGAAESATAASWRASMAQLSQDVRSAALSCCGPEMPRRFRMKPKQVEQEFAEAQKNRPRDGLAKR